MKREENAFVAVQILRQCRAMASYAFGAGLRVPETLVDELRQGERAVLAGLASGDAAGVSRPVVSNPRPAVDRDAAPRAAYPVSRPHRTDTGIETLARVHNRLAEIVTPATPRTILLLADEEKRGSILRFLGAVPLIRRLLAVAVLSMGLFVWISLSEDVDGTGFDLLENSGVKLLLSELFLISAASIGVSFASLFEAQRYVKDGTFDPKYESSYWMRYVLGLMAGTILALLVPIEALAGEQESSSILHQLGQPMLALLGGFSASAVHRILSRIVAAIESLVQGDTRDLVAAQERVAKAKHAERETQSRMELSSQLIHLEKELSGSGDPEAALETLREFQQRLIRGD